MNDIPPVFILCGGKATRLGALCSETAKAMIPFNGKPFIQHQLQSLQRQGVVRAVLCIGHLGHQIQDFVQFGSKFDLCVSYSWDDGIGTGGALRKALLASTDEEILVLYGDSFVTCNIQDLCSYDCRYSFGRWGTIAASLPAIGAVDLPNILLADGLAFYSKRLPNPRARYVDHGISILRRDVLIQNTGSGSFDLAEYLELASSHHMLCGFEVRTPYYEIGSYAGMDSFRSTASRWRTDV
jgi:NDP-sugar pyrophosphorylase family protein